MSKRAGAELVRGRGRSAALFVAIFFPVSFFPFWLLQFLHYTMGLIGLKVMLFLLSSACLSSTAFNNYALVISTNQIAPRKCQQFSREDIPIPSAMCKRY